jgi:hypothetical protein
MPVKRGYSDGLLAAGIVRSAVMGGVTVVLAYLSGQAALHALLGIKQLLY